MTNAYGGYGGGTCNTTFTEMYSYNSGGARLGKRLRLTRSGLSNLDLNGSFTYDNEGRMTGEQYPLSGPNLSYGLDSMGRLYSLTAGDTIVGSATYGAAGQLLSLSGGAYGTETRTYNSILQLTQLSSAGLNLQYHYPATGNNGKIDYQYDVVSGEQVNYTYDSLNRLATAVTSDNPNVTQWGQSYSFDGFGNLTGQTVIKGSAPAYSASYNPANNQQYSDCADANGNVFGLASCAGANAYAYDVENRVTAPANAGGMHYSYAPGNKRVWRGGNGSTDEVTYWGVTGQKLATYQLSSASGQLVGTQTGTNYYFGAKLIKNAGGWVYQDRLGSIGKYYPYGQERPSATANGTEKFTGYFRDAETGLDYAVNRYEPPGTGRFLTPDPFGHAYLSSPGSWNQYSYAGGDPVNSNDPSGLDTCPAGTTMDPVTGQCPGAQYCFYTYHTVQECQLLLAATYSDAPDEAPIPSLRVLAHTLDEQGPPPGVCDLNPFFILCDGPHGGPPVAKKPTICSNDAAVNFVNDSLADASTLANQLRVPAEWVLAVPFIESTYGTSPAAMYDNNYFGFHWDPSLAAYGAEQSPRNPIFANWSRYPDGILPSGAAFVGLATKDGAVGGVSQTMFFSLLHQQFGVSNANYVNTMTRAVSTIRTILKDCLRQ